MTPVQAATIPVFTSHKDVIVSAVTGSGKTLAFLVPIIEIISKTRPPSSKHIQAIVVSPTRELAAQTYSVAKELTDIPCLLLTGGTSHHTDIEAMKAAEGANIVIATPGRLEAVLKNETLGITTTALEVLVLDEADVLLDLGFHTSLTKILSLLPKQRRTGLFSATLSAPVEELIRLAGIRNPARIEVQSSSTTTPSALMNTYKIVPSEFKLGYLLEYLRLSSSEKQIVFMLTRALVEYYSILLEHFCPGVTVLGIHGSMAQKKRLGIMETFRNEPKAILLCTDLVARGIDVDDVTEIIQFDAPQNPDFFIHRVGRTARMGRSGNALVLLTAAEIEYVDLLAEKNVPVVKLEDDIDVESEEFTSKCLLELEEVRQLALADRDVMEKGKKAFVSFVRGYKEHHCMYIFRWKTLDFAGVARGMGLLFVGLYHGVNSNLPH